MLFSPENSRNVRDDEWKLPFHRFFLKQGGFFLKQGALQLIGGDSWGDGRGGPLVPG